MSDLEGKTICVTGGASGLARATAILASQRGANIVLGDVNTAGLEKTADEIREWGGHVRTIRTDVRDAADCAALVDLAVQSFGGIDGAVCAAGIGRVVPGVEMTLEQWQEVIDVNLTGNFLTVQAAARVMLAAGRPGAIVTFASGLAIRGQLNGAHYAASKAGILGLTKSFALELAGRQIRVNAVAPGLVDTPILNDIAGHYENYVENWAKANPMGRVGVPDDIAKAVCFLLSDDAGFVTGQALHVNGGSLMP